MSKNNSKSNQKKLNQKGSDVVMKETKTKVVKAEPKVEATKVVKAEPKVDTSVKVEKKTTSPIGKLAFSKRRDDMLKDVKSALETSKCRHELIEFIDNELSKLEKSQAKKTQQKADNEELKKEFEVQCRLQKSKFTLHDIKMSEEVSIQKKASFMKGLISADKAEKDAKKLKGRTQYIIL